MCLSTDAQDPDLQVAPSDMSIGVFYLVVSLAQTSEVCPPILADKSTILQKNYQNHDLICSMSLWSVGVTSIKVA